MTHIVSIKKRFKKKKKNNKNLPETVGTIFYHLQLQFLTVYQNVPHLLFHCTGHRGQKSENPTWLLSQEHLCCGPEIVWVTDKWRYFEFNALNLFGFFCFVLFFFVTDTYVVGTLKSNYTKNNMYL